MTDREIGVNVLFLSDDDLSEAFSSLGQPILELLSKLVADGMISSQEAEREKAAVGDRVRQAVARLRSADLQHRIAAEVLQTEGDPRRTQ